MKYDTAPLRTTLRSALYIWYMFSSISGNSSDSESSYGSQCDSEYNYIPSYNIEDEPIDTSHEVKTLEAVDREILDDHDSLYAVEPLADEEF